MIQSYRPQSAPAVLSTAENAASALFGPVGPVSVPPTQVPPPYGAHHALASLLTPENATCGLIATFKWDNVPNNSILRQQPHVNDKAERHPMCIVGLKDNNQVACCLQMTSFSSRSIQDKYQNPRNPMRLQYLALQHEKTDPHNELPVLHLMNGQTMKNQTYVHLDFFFQIETRYLESYCNGAKCLDRQSVDVLEEQFADFVEGRTFRPTWQEPRPKSPLDGLHHYTAHSLGVPHHSSARRGSDRSFAARPTFLLPAPGNHAIAITPPSSPASGWRTNSSVSSASTSSPVPVSREPRRDSPLASRSQSRSPPYGTVQNASRSVALPSPQTSPETITLRANVDWASWRERSPRQKDLSSNWRQNARPVR